jgi:hypothetical protein
MLTGLLRLRAAGGREEQSVEAQTYLFILASSFSYAEGEDGDDDEATILFTSRLVYSRTI